MSLENSNKCWKCITKLQNDIKKCQKFIIKSKKQKKNIRWKFSDTPLKKYQNIIKKLAGFARCCSAEPPICNVKLNKIGLAGFTPWRVVKAVIEFKFFHIAKSRSETKLSFLETQLIKKSICVRLRIATS